MSFICAVCKLSSPRDTGRAYVDTESRSIPIVTDKRPIRTVIASRRVEYPDGYRGTEIVREIDVCSDCHPLLISRLRDSQLSPSSPGLTVPIGARPFGRS